MTYYFVDNLNGLRAGNGYRGFVGHWCHEVRGTRGCIFWGQYQADLCDPYDLLDASSDGLSWWQGNCPYCPELVHKIE